MFSLFAVEKKQLSNQVRGWEVLDLELHFLDAGQNLCHIQTTGHAPQARGTIDKPHSYRVSVFGRPNIAQAWLRVRIVNNHQPLQRLCER